MENGKQAPGDECKDDVELHELLGGYFKAKGRGPQEISDFFKGFAKFYGYDFPNQVEKQLRDSVVAKAGRQQKKQKERERRNLVRALVAYGVPAATFGAKEEDLFPSIRIAGPRFLNISDPDKNPTFKKAYKSIAIECLEFATEQLLVHDYLGRGDREVPTMGIENYFEIHTEIFGEIEKMLGKHKEMHYTRILALHIKGGHATTGDKHLIEEALLQCSPQLFLHICTCLRDFGPHVAFWVTKTPSRTYQYAVLKGKTEVLIYEEQYELRKNGDAYPSFVTIQKSAPDEEWHFIYDGEIRNHMKDKNAMMLTYHQQKPDKFDIAVRFRSLVSNLRQNTFGHVETQAGRELAISILDNKICIFNDVLGMDEKGKKKEGWIHVHPLHQ